METSAPEISNSIRSRRLWRLYGIEAVIEGQRGHLFPWGAVCLGVGIAIFFALRFEPQRIDLIICAVMTSVALAFAALSSRNLSPLFWAVALVCAGIVLAAYRTHSVAAPSLTFRYYGPIEGRVIAIDRSHSQKPRLTLDQVRLDRMSPERTPARVRVSLHGDQPYLVPEPGMRVAITGHLSPPSGPVEPGGFDFQRHSWFQQLGAVGYTRSPALRLAPANRQTFGLWLYGFRKDLSDGIKARMSAREGPFAVAIITGDRSDLDAEAVAVLRGSNLAHLLAISGLHMGLLTGAVLALMRILLAFSPVTIFRIAPKKIAAVTALIAAFLYLGISGASVATQRAFIMAVVMLIAICIDKRALTLRAVTLAALAVLIIRPESLVGPGFQMSFSATIALVAVFAALRDNQTLYTLPSWARGFAMLVISSGVAGLATAPYGAAHFNQMAQYGLIANLVSVPVMGLVVMPGAIVAALLLPLGLEGIGLAIMDLGLRWILFVAVTISEQNGAIRLIPSPSVWVLPLITLGGLLLCLCRHKLRLTGIVPIVAALIVWSYSERPQMLISESGMLIGVMQPTGRALTKPKGDGFTAESWLENDGDGASQEMAAGRGEFGKKTGVVRLGDHLIRYDFNKDLEKDALDTLCRGADLIIVSNSEAEGSCASLNKYYFRENGSLAIDIEEGALILKTTNAHRGARIWIP